MKLVTYDSPQAVCHCWKLSGHPEITIETYKSFVRLSANPSIVHAQQTVLSVTKNAFITLKNV